MTDDRKTKKQLLDELAAVRSKLEQATAPSADSDRYRSIIQTATDGFLLVDAVGNIQDVNDALCRILGYGRDELTAMKVSDIEAVESTPDIAAHLTAVIEKGGDRFETRHRTKDGRIIDVEVSTSYVPSDHLFVSFVRDITERRQAVDLLQKSEELYRSLIDNLDMGICLVDRDYRIVMTNAVIGRLMQKPVEAFTGSHCFREFEKRDVICDHCPGKVTLATGKPAEAERSGFRDDGTQIYVHIRTIPVMGANGSPSGFIEIVEDITERKKSQMALDQSEERFRGIIELAVDAILLGDPTGAIIGANTQATALTGYDRNELLGRNIMMLFPDEQLKLKPLRYDLLKQGKIVRTERLLMRKDGSLVPIEMNTKMMPDGTYQAFIRDVTERAEAEERLRRSSERLALHINNTPLAYIEWNGAFEIVEWNDAAEQMFGRPRSMALGRRGESLFSHDGADSPLRRVWDELRAGATATHLSVRHRQTDGRTLDGDWYFTALRDRSNAFNGAVAFVLDVSEQRRAEDALRRRGRMVSRHNETLAALARDATLHAGTLRSAVGVILERAAEAMETARTSLWLFTPDRHGIRCLDLFELSGRKHTDGYELTLADYPRYFDALATGECIPAVDARLDPRTAEFTASYLVPLGIFSMLDVPIRVGGQLAGVLCFEQTGSKRYWNMEEQNFVTAIGGFVVTIIESAERRRVQDALRDTEQKLREIVEHSTNLFYMHTTDHVLTYVSPQSRSFFNCSPEEALVNWTSFLTDNPLNEKGIVATERAIETGLPQPPYELELKSANGRLFWVEVHEAPIVRDGRTVAIVGALTDITDRKHTEEEHLKTQKLESVGLLAGGIAHDFNNLLTAILGNINLSALDLPPGSQAAQRLAKAEKATLIARDLTHQLLTFSKGGAPVRKTANLPEIIENAADFATRGTNCRCEVAIEGDLLPADIDESQIHQAISNLIINAVQAMPGGGTVSVAAENTTISGASEPHIHPGSYIKIEVADKGAGIPRELLPKIFDPYFTTKKQGSGLGLAVTYSVIRNHDGRISVDSTPGAGTVFRVYLPASDSKPAKPAAPSTSALSGRGRILLMDDEQMIRETASALLTAMEYSVTAVPDGEAAVREFESHLRSGTPFDAVILDLTVPGGMGGTETIVRLKEIAPGVRAIVSSGYSNDPVMANFEQYGFSGVVTKPYRISELSALLQAVLNP